MTSCNILRLAAGVAALSFASATPAGDGESLPLDPPPATVPFEGCGILEIPNDGSGCVTLVTHNGGTYSLEVSGDFEDGDAVCVSGDLSHGQCITNCDAIGCIFDNTITDQFDGFGSYLQGFECGVLLAEDGAQYQINGPLPDGIEMGSAIHVSGTLDADCFSFCGFVCIQDAIVSFARTESGTIAAGPQGCPSLNTGSEFLLLENLGGFTYGDAVIVTGAFEPESLLCLPVSFPGLESNTIAGFFAGPGTIGPGPQSCVLFNADSGESFVIEGTGGFGFFDRVYMTGRVNPASQACFPVAPLTALEDSTIAGLFEGCGELQPGPQGCLYVGTDDGGFFVVGDTQGAELLGGVISLSGIVIPEFQGCFPVTGTALDILEIDSCVEGDATLDGRTDVDDIVAVIVNWNTDDFWADVDRSGAVSIDDIVMVVTNWTP